MVQQRQHGHFWADAVIFPCISFPWWTDQNLLGLFSSVIAEITTSKKYKWAKSVDPNSAENFPEVKLVPDFSSMTLCSTFPPILSKAGWEDSMKNLGSRNNVASWKPSPTLPGEGGGMHQHIMGCCRCNLEPNLAHEVLGRLALYIPHIYFTEIFEVGRWCDASLGTRTFNKVPTKVIRMDNWQIKRNEEEPETEKNVDAQSRSHFFWFRNCDQNGATCGQRSAHFTAREMTSRNMMVMMQKIMRMLHTNWINSQGRCHSRERGKQAQLTPWVTILFIPQPKLSTQHKLICPQFLFCSHLP